MAFAGWCKLTSCFHNLIKSLGLLIISVWRALFFIGGDSDELLWYLYFLVVYSKIYKQSKVWNHFLFLCGIGWCISIHLLLQVYFSSLLYVWGEENMISDFVLDYRKPKYWTKICALNIIFLNWRWICFSPSNKVLRSKLVKTSNYNMFIHPHESLYFSC